MRKGQGLPVNMIVLTALALLALVVIGSFFITGFGEASGSFQSVEADQAECQSTCQGISVSSMNYYDCSNLALTQQAINYQTCGLNYGSCTVTIRGGDQCSCDQNGCHDSGSICTQLCNDLIAAVTPKSGCNQDGLTEASTYALQCPGTPCFVECTYQGAGHSYCDTNNNEYCWCTCNKAGPCSGSRTCLGVPHS